jgi:hypothetical protein
MGKTLFLFINSRKLSTSSGADSCSNRKINPEPGRSRVNPFPSQRQSQDKITEHFM